MYAILFSLVSLPAQTPAPDVPSAESLERTVLVQRRSIKSGRATIESKIFKGGQDTPLMEITRRHWFAGNQERCEVVRVEGGRETLRMHECLNCEREGHYIRYSPESADSDGRRLLRLRKVDKSTKERLSFLIDLRLVGLIAQQTGQLSLRHYHLQSVLLYPDRKDLRVDRDAWEGKPCWVVRYNYRTRGNVSVWIVPELAHSVVKVLSEVTRDGVHHSAAVTSEVSPHGKDRIWFPTRVVFESRRDGVVTEREVAEIKDLSLNEPLPPETFRLDGLKLQPGTPIRFDGDEKMYSWDGQKPKAYTPRDHLDLPAQLEEGSQKRQLWLIVLTVGLSVLAALLVGRYYLRGHRSSASS